MHRSGTRQAYRQSGPWGRDSGGAREDAGAPRVGEKERIHPPSGGSSEATGQSGNSNNSFNNTGIFRLETAESEQAAQGEYS